MAKSTDRHLERWFSSYIEYSFISKIFIILTYERFIYRELRSLLFNNENINISGLNFYICSLHTYIYICEALLLKKIDINTLKMAKDDPTPQDCYVNSMINQVVYLIFLTCQTFWQLAGLKVVLIIDMLNNIHTLEMHIFHCTRNR